MVVLHKHLQLQAHQFIMLVAEVEVELLDHSMDLVEVQPQPLKKAVQVMEQHLAQEQV